MAEKRIDAPESLLGAALTGQVFRPEVGGGRSLGALLLNALKQTGSTLLRAMNPEQVVQTPGVLTEALTMMQPTGVGRGTVKFIRPKVRSTASTVERLAKIKPTTPVQHAAVERLQRGQSFAPVREHNLRPAMARITDKGPVVIGAGSVGGFHADVIEQLQRQGRLGDIKNLLSGFVDSEGRFLRELDVATLQMPDEIILDLLERGQLK